MSSKIRSSTSPKQCIRLNRKKRITKKIFEKRGRHPRLIVFRSNRYMVAQIIDDLKGHTLVSANTQEDPFKSMSSKKNLAAAQALGKLVAERGKKNNIESVVFDRNGYFYHGRIKAFADSAREAGLKF